MTTRFASVCAGLAGLALLTGTASVASAGPDFTTRNPQARTLAPSDGTRDLSPFDDVMFGFDSAALYPAAQDQIARAARWLAKHPRQHLVLEGYADNSGGAAYNQDLSQRRAGLVRNHLIGLGVDAERVVVVIYGERAAKTRARNPLDRRVVLYTTPRPAREIARYSIDHKRAIHAVWTEDGVQYTQRAEHVALR